METRVKTRKLIELGGSLTITLPREYIRKAGLQKGDVVGVVYDGLFVVINPNKPREAELNVDNKRLV